MAGSDVGAGDLLGDVVEFPQVGERVDGVGEVVAAVGPAFVAQPADRRGFPQCARLRGGVVEERVRFEDRDLVAVAHAVDELRDVVTPARELGEVEYDVLHGAPLSPRTVREIPKNSLRRPNPTTAICAGRRT